MDHKMRKFKKHYYLNTPEQKKEQQKTIDTLAAEMVLEKSLRDFRRKQLKEEIDLSLSQKNKKEFLRLTKELAQLS